MKTMTLVLIAAAFVLTAAGCDVTESRKQGASIRWEQTMDNVRLSAARESFAKGQYDYARKVLEPCMASKRSQPDAERLMAQIQAADQMYAQLADYRDGDDTERVY